MKTRNKLLATALTLAVPICTWAQTEVEPNNNTGQATAVAYNTAIAGSTGACSPTDNSIDYFTFTPPSQGALRLQFSASNSGAGDLDITVNIRNNSNQTLGTFTVPAGANNVALDTTIHVTCTGTDVYYLVFNNPSSSVCTNYSFTYDILDPFYGNDGENNDNTSQATDTIAPGTNMDGHVNFYYDDAIDYYRILAPNDGMMTVQVVAEHAGNTPGTVTVYLKNDIDQTLETWTAKVGGNSMPDTTTFS
ncbi:MAG: hypothetical protein J5I62_00155 [Flavobacteriales bacterium]|nr:hypothetical protein [Flavobacteriales bacterium]